MASKGSPSIIHYIAPLEKMHFCSVMAETSFGEYPDKGSTSSLSERTDFSAGKVDGKLMPCLSDSSELIAGSVNNGSQVQND